MPASLPGSTATVNTTGNPSTGNFVVMCPLSGPKGSPKDTDTTGNASTGALSTGLGFGVVLTGGASGITAAGYTDDYIPGVTKPDGTAGNSTLLYIGGGKSDANGVSVPYTAGCALQGAGQGGSRDAGAGPAFTGFGLKMVTATGTVANGAAVETGFTNRSGGSLASGSSVFGSATAASAAPS